VKNLLLILVAISLCFGTAFAAPITIDFESEPVGVYGGGSVTITVGAIPVHFSGPGLQIRQFGSPFPNTRVLSTSADAGPITISFGGGFLADYVEFENIVNGRYTSEVDSPIGTAYDSASNVLDTLQSSATIHRLNGPGIASVVYTEAATGEGFVIDNFTFDGTVVPEPSSLWLAAAGIVAILIGRRRVTN